MGYGHVDRERSLRLLFQFVGPNIELVDIKESRARPMPHEEVSQEQPTEFWYELHDDDNRPVFRRPESNPLLAGVEYLTGDSEHAFVREPPDDHRGRFLLTVPAIDATSVVLYGVVPGDNDHRPRQLGEFDIRRPAIASV